MKQGPALYNLTQRLAETPSVFTGSRGIITAAVVSDLLFDAGGSFPDPAAAEKFKMGSQKDKSLRELILITCHLFHDSWFLEKNCYTEKMAAFLSGKKLKALAKIVKSRQFVNDPDRREELARLALDALGLVPEGESETAAADRLTTLDSMERVRLVEQTRKARERARKLREAMERKHAAEAASKMSRE